jgi:hypothetical protein
MNVLITLTTAGADTGPFNLYSNTDSYVTAFATGIAKSVLVAGYTSTVVPTGTSTIRVKSTGACTNYVDLDISGIPTTTTTTTVPGQTTTTTTTVPGQTTTTTTTVTFYSFLLNSTSGLGTGPAACADYASFNRATFYASFANGNTIHSGTFLYTDSGLTTPISNGYYSDGTTYWQFTSGNTGDAGNPCVSPTTTTTTTAAPTTTTTTTAAPGTTTTTTTAPLPTIFVDFSLQLDASNTGSMDIYTASPIGAGFTLSHTLTFNGDSWSVGLLEGDGYYVTVTQDTRDTAGQRGQIADSLNGSPTYYSTAAGALPQSVSSSARTLVDGNTYNVLGICGDVV